MLHHAADGIGINNRLLEATGFAALLDPHLDAVLAGMTPECLPPDEANLLRTFGFEETSEHLPGFVSWFGSKRSSG